jgi:protein-S-isoprenylcysteine O-methyltransferase Ste14
MLKSLFFPDKRFQTLVSTSSALHVSAVLIIYLFFPYVVISNTRQNSENSERIFWASLSTILGLFLMTGADIQKGTHLSLKKELISNGLFSRTRNPNYLGEILIYLGFGILTENWLCYFFLVFVWSTLFLINMLFKEYSFMNKNGWEIYKENSYILLPKIYVDSDWKNLVLYLTLFSLISIVYANGGLFQILPNF